MTYHSAYTPNHQTFFQVKKILITHLIPWILRYFTPEFSEYWWSSLNKYEAKTSIHINYDIRITIQLQTTPCESFQSIWQGLSIITLETEDQIKDNLIVLSFISTHIELCLLILDISAYFRSKFSLQQMLTYSVKTYLMPGKFAYNRCFGTVSYFHIVLRNNSYSDSELQILILKF